MKKENPMVPLTKQEIGSLGGGLQSGEFVLIKTSNNKWFYGILRNQMSSQKSSTHPEGFEPVRIPDLDLELKYDIRSARLNVLRHVVGLGTNRIVREWRRVTAEWYRWEETEDHYLARRQAERGVARLKLLDSLRGETDNLSVIADCMAEHLGISKHLRSRPARSAAERIRQYVRHLSAEDCVIFRELVRDEARSGENGHHRANRL